MTERPHNFDRVARIYRWAEYLSLGPLLERTREHFIPQLSRCRRTLVLGDGDGRFLARLLARNPTLRAVAVDSSAAMLHLLRRRCAFAAQRLQTENTSALVLDPIPHADLIVTHFFLDCFTQPEVDALIQRLSTRLGPGGLWLLSDFAVPTTPLIRTLARLYIRALYLAFGILTGMRTTCLPDPQTALARAGFERIARRERLFGVLYTELWQYGLSRPRETPPKPLK